MPPKWQQAARHSDYIACSLVYICQKNNSQDYCWFESNYLISAMVTSGSHVRYKFNMISNLFQSPRAAARKDFSPCIAVCLFCSLKSEKDSDRSILTSIYFSISSLRYSGAVPLNTLNVWNRILYCDLKRTKKTHIWRCIIRNWNLPKLRPFPWCQRKILRASVTSEGYK